MKNILKLALHMCLVLSVVKLEAKQQETPDNQGKDFIATGSFTDPIAAQKGIRGKEIDIYEDAYKEFDAKIEKFLYSKLEQACKTGNIEQAAQILNIKNSFGVDINEGFPDGYTALMRTAKFGHVDAANFLLQKGALVDAEDASGQTALLIAAKYGKSEVAKILIEHGANVNHVDKSRQSVLAWANSSKDNELVELLKSHGATLGSKAPSKAPVTPKSTASLTKAIQSDDLEVVHKLILQGANVNEVDSKGMTPLMYAAFNGYNDVVKMLIAAHANVNAKNSKGKTALDLAQFNDHDDVVAMLRAASKGEL